MKKRKVVLISILVICAVVGGIFIWRARHPSAQTATTQPQVAKVRLDTLATTISASGNVSMPHQAKMTFGVSGTIEEINVAFGDQVKQDQVLAKLDTTSLEQSLAQAQTNLKLAQSALDKIQHPPESDKAQATAAVSSAKANLSSAEDALNDLKNPSEISLAQAKSAVSTATVNLQSAQEALNKAQDQDNGIVAQARATVRDAQLALDNANRDLDSAQTKAIQDVKTAQDAVKTQEDLYSLVTNNYVIGKATIDDLNKQKLNLDNARAQLEITQSNADKSVANAQNTVTKAQDTLLQAQKDLTTVLHSTSPTGVASKQAQVDSAQVALLQAQKTLADMLAGGDPIVLASAQAKVDNARAALLAAQNTLNDMLAGGNADTLVQKRAQVDNAQQTVDNAQKQIDQATITAPFNGVISTNVSVKKGDTVSPGTVIMQLVDTTQLQINGLIDEVDIMQAKTGQKVNISFDILPGMQFQGTVQAISPVGQSQSGVVSYPTSITFNTPPSRVSLRDGLDALINIVVTEKPNVLVVPSRAVKTSGGKATVQVMVNGVAQDRSVTTGMSNGTMTEVTSGLSEGEEVVVQATTTTSSTAGGNVRIGGGIPGGGTFRG